MITHKTFIKLGVYLSLKYAGTPFCLSAFIEVIVSRIIALNAHKYAIMRPTQFATQCVAFWECKIKLPHIAQIWHCESITKFRRQPQSKSIYKPLTIFCPTCSALFFYNFPTDIPIRLNHCRIGGGVNSRSRFCENRTNIFEQFVPNRFHNLDYRFSFPFSHGNLHYDYDATAKPFKAVSKETFAENFFCITSSKSFDCIDSLYAAIG